MDKRTRKTFDSLLILISWSMWLERNARTFNRVDKMATLLAQMILEDAYVGDAQEGLAHLDVLAH